MLSLILICFLTLSCSFAQDNITKEVIRTDINEQILTDEPTGNFNDLSQDIKNAGNTLEFNKNYKYVNGDVVPKSGLSINKTLTIDGKGHTIDASNKVNIFSIPASNVILKNINFINAYLDEYHLGCAVTTTGVNTTFENCNFTNCKANDQGGAIKSSASGLTVNNCNFKSNQGTSDGAIRIIGPNAKITNSLFTNNSAKIGGGAISILSQNCLIENCTFENNYNLKNNIGDGGAILIYRNGQNTRIINSTFKSNEANAGGAIEINSAPNVSIINSYFENNTAKRHGGAIMALTTDCIINNCEFVNNTAVSGGGVYIAESESDVTYYSNNHILNSTFRNNYARYGGGAVTATGYSFIENSIFINNSAGSYGGAVDLTNSIIENSTLKDNNAIFGGGLYIQNSRVTNSTFINNVAKIGNSIYILNIANLENNTILNEDIYTFSEADGQIIGQHDIDMLMQTADGYFAYCAEEFNSSPYYGVYDHTMGKLLNAINHVSVSEHLKILIYQYINHMQDLKDNDFHNYVWAFTDHEYWNSKDPIVQEVLGLYENGFRVPSVNACKVLSNGTLMYFNFSSMITPSGQQNMFLFKFWYGNQINETLTKEALNKTAKNGDYVDYRIVVTNKGTEPVYSIWVEDNDYSKGLIYESWRSEIGNWNYNNSTGQWQLDVLNPSQSASIILRFKVSGYGKLYNNATSGIGNITVTNSTDDIYVYTPNFTVEKIALDKIVVLGNQTKFEIIVKNTGELDLNSIFVEEFSYTGLIYAGWKENKNWNYSYTNNKHRWTLNGTLPIGGNSSFIVIFNTTARGNFTNIVVSGSNKTDNKTVNDTVEVLSYNLTVNKKTITKKVKVGSKVEFEIIVKNTGDLVLEDIFVCESKYDSGLVYLRYYSVKGNWKYSYNNGKFLFKLDSLNIGESASFRVIFKVNKIGNLSNTVEAGFNNNTFSNSTNTTEVVNESIPQKQNSTIDTKTIQINKSEEITVDKQMNDKSTGNPILVLLLALIIIPLRRFKN